MASRFEIERQQKKINILSIAKNIFVEKGYENTTVDEIAHAAGIAKGSIYTYFDTKTDLLTQIVLDLLGKLKRDLQATELAVDVAADEFKLRNSSHMFLLRYIPILLDQQEVEDSITSISGLLNEKYNSQGELLIKQILADLILEIGK